MSTEATADRVGEAHPALAMRGVGKSFGTVRAVHGLDLDVAPGEVVAVIGPSGCGKSTALRLVAGLEDPDAGEVRIAGELVAGGGRRPLPPERRRVGMVFQDHALFPHLTVARNVAFGLHGRPPAEREARVREVLGLVRLAEMGGRYPHELSGGEQQRVALARALAPRPAVVLLDEPFSSLDEGLRAQVRAELVGALRATGTTALLVTHDQTEALSVGDRVAVLRDGVVEQVGTPDAVFERPATRFVASFMGDADFLPGRLHDGALTCELGTVPTVPGWAAHGGDVEVVLRPHEVALAPAQPGAPDAALVVGVEYHGAFLLHTVRLASGRTVRSWQPHAGRLPVGTAVAAAVVAEVVPTVLVDGRAVTAPAPRQGAVRA